MRTAFDSILQDFIVQRRYRDGKRKELIRAFEANKHVFRRQVACEIKKENEVITQLHVGNAEQQRSDARNERAHQTIQPINEQAHSQHRIHIEELPVQPHPNYHFQHPPLQTDPTQPIEPSLSPEQFQILSQNHALKKQLLDLQQTERETIISYQVEVENLKNKYIQEIQTMTQKASEYKKDIHDKVTNMKELTEGGLKKNLQVAQANVSLKQELRESTQMMEKFMGEIKSEYTEKLITFEKICESSSTKAAELQQSYNEDELIETTLSNEEFLTTLLDSSSKLQNVDKVLSDYSSLLLAKREIFTELTSNNELKEQELQKMGTLESKMREIASRLEAEKKAMEKENGEMGQELVEIKELLMEAMGQQQ